MDLEDLNDFDIGDENLKQYEIDKDLSMRAR